MNYIIRVEGGFTGIPKTYQGELNLSSKEINTLLNSIKQSSKLSENLRDGLTYDVEINHMAKVFTAVFDDKNIPEPIRRIVSEST